MHQKKRERERTQINKIRNEKVEVTTNTTDIQKIVINYYEQLYAKKKKGQPGQNRQVSRNLPELNQEEAESLNKMITTSEIEAVIKKKKNLPKALDWMDSQVNFNKHLKKN